MKNFKKFAPVINYGCYIFVLSVSLIMIYTLLNYFERFPEELAIKKANEAILNSFIAGIFFTLSSTWLIYNVGNKIKRWWVTKKNKSILDKS